MAETKLNNPAQPYQAKVDWPHLMLAPLWAYIASIAVPAVFLTADVILPRGATAAIGYCLVPVVAAGTRRRGFLLLMTVLCTVLTAIGYFTEAPGGAWWMSVFDRFMVAGVLWLTFILTRRRATFIRTLMDQTQALRTTATELRRSNAELERFASVVAHDLRGPLSTIGLFAELMAQPGSTENTSDSDEYVRTIRHELNRMNGLIQRLLTYGRAGARELHTTTCDCGAVLAEVKQRLKADLDHHGAQITNDPLPVLRADTVLLAELFQNLIENGIKYHGATPPAIHVSAAKESGSWLFSVRDNGVGIPSEDCDKIFAPFRQLHGDKPKAGVGLGLATCKRIVERHGGRIWVQSTPAEGSTFSFTIPELPPPAPVVTLRTKTPAGVAHAV